MASHQDIQYDKQDSGNILSTCSYGRHDMAIIDNLVIKHMKSDSPIPKVAPNVAKPKTGKPPKTVWSWKSKSSESKSNTDPIVVCHTFGTDKEEMGRD
ncbi:hypothetical protein [Staphylococcus coagulans]|uniref:hypothetical protein n=1 Tax=Staphylococcus coagulans TaxID=74706 RepID=UPI003364C70C